MSLKPIKNTRLAPRYIFHKEHLPVCQVAFDPERPAFAAVIRDLSSTGINFETKDAQFAIGDVVQIELETLGLPRMACTGIIVRLKLEEEDSINYAVQFRNFPRLFEERLNSNIENAIDALKTQPHNPNSEKSARVKDQVIRASQVLGIFALMLATTAFFTKINAVTSIANVLKALGL